MPKLIGIQTRELWAAIEVKHARTATVGGGRKAAARMTVYTGSVTAWRSRWRRKTMKSPICGESGPQPRRGQSARRRPASASRIVFTVAFVRTATAPSPTFSGTCRRSTKRDANRPRSRPIGQRPDPTWNRQMKAGGQFYCHKGVPIDPRSEHGFLCPHDRNGRPLPSKYRLCRGYLNMVGRKPGCACTARSLLFAL